MGELMRSLPFKSHPLGHSCTRHLADLFHIKDPNSSRAIRIKTSNLWSISADLTQLRKHPKLGRTKRRGCVTRGNEALLGYQTFSKKSPGGEDHRIGTGRSHGSRHTSIG